MTRTRKGRIGTHAKKNKVGPMGSKAFSDHAKKQATEQYAKGVGGPGKFRDANVKRIQERGGAPDERVVTACKKETQKAKDEGRNPRFKLKKNGKGVLVFPTPNGAKMSNGLLFAKAAGYASTKRLRHAKNNNGGKGMTLDMHPSLINPNRTYRGKPTLKNGWDRLAFSMSF